MVSAKGYLLALLLACLIQVSLAVPMSAELIAREVRGPAEDGFGGGGGGGPPDW